MIVSTPNQITESELRVTLTPDAIERLTVLGLSVHIESGAGIGAGYSDQSYVEQGATIVDGDGAWAGDIVAVITPPTIDEISRLKPGAVLVGLLRPLDEPEIAQHLAARNVTALAFEVLPRITRAQPMDALSSQATVVGYQAVLEAASRLTHFMPMLTTAAGTIPPSRALILGAGVAGLQAIATARRLGAVVQAFDVRSAAAEQVQSLGATFIEAITTPQDASTQGGYAQELGADEQTVMVTNLAPTVIAADIVVTTAQIPGRPAPLLITNETVAQMKAGSVIVDAAAATGGNCEATVPGETVVVDGVIIVGDTNLASRVAGDASRMYARNVTSLLGLMVLEGAISLEDEVVAGCLVTHDGAITNERIRSMLEVAS